MFIVNKVIIGSDHAGFEYKEILKKYLSDNNIEFFDAGTHSEASCDYPDIAHALAEKVNDNLYSFGILLCGSANGVAIVANKHHKVRAAICWNNATAMLARQHNNANIICIPARFVTIDEAMEMTKLFLSTEFEGGRHQNRIDKI